MRLLLIDLQIDLLGIVVSGVVGRGKGNLVCIYDVDCSGKVNGVMRATNAPDSRGNRISRGFRCDVTRKKIMGAKETSVPIAGAFLWRLTIFGRGAASR